MTTTWTHLLARPLVRPLVGTGVTPNHLTTARLITGLLAAAALVPGDSGWRWWAGWLWLLSAFLDRADGELARVGNMATLKGRLWDDAVDKTVATAFFFAMGIGLRHSALGGWAIALGLIAGSSVLLATLSCESLERGQNFAINSYSRVFGFDPDDLFYLLAPGAWLGWLTPILIGSAIVGTALALLTGWRVRRLARRHPGSATETFSI